MTKKIIHNIKSIYPILLILVIPVSCNVNVGYKNPQQISKSIENSRKNNVFFNNYSFVNIEILDQKITFPFDQVWEEKHWNFVLDKNGKEVPKIDDSSSHLIVFKYKENNSAIPLADLGKKWIMWADSTKSAGSISGMLNMSVLKGLDNDTLSFTIYRQQKPFDVKNNLIPMIKFKIVSVK